MTPFTTFALRDYQKLAVDDAVSFLRSAAPGARRLYAAPTGSGKSVIELHLQNCVAGSWIVTPAVEVIQGLLDKLGLPIDLPETALLESAFARRITTPIRFRNLLLRGGGVVPPALILDEAHHHNADTWQQIDLLTGLPPTVGYTATPYRGTPRGTAVLRERWGEPVWILTYPEAVARGVISMPSCRIVPLLDDDIVEVKSGEFDVKSVETASRGLLENVADLCRGYCRELQWDRPTMFAVPSTLLAHELTRVSNAAGLPSVCVVGDSTRRERDEAFAAVVEHRAALVQVRVVGEGVDLPIRRLVDLSPAISPVKWLQLFGRITRPVAAGESPPDYVCCNRNLLRHAYLLEGCLPAAVLSDAQKQFGAGTRSGYRVLGVEGLGRFKETHVPLHNGLEGFLYCLAAVEGLQVVNYAAFVHPALAEPIWATRIDAKKADGTRAFGRWRRAEPPDDLTGFASVPASSPSPKQLAWWKKDAARYGLSADVAPNKRTFQALPIFADLGLRVK